MNLYFFLLSRVKCTFFVFVASSLARVTQFPYNKQLVKVRPENIDNSSSNQ